MGNSRHRITLICYCLLWSSAFKPTSTTVTVTAYDSTGIVQQQPLTLVCNYTDGGSDQIVDFKWRHGDDIILSGTVTPNQTHRFQDGTEWYANGVFLGDYTSSLTIQLPASSLNPNVAGQYTCIVSSRTKGVQDTATANVKYAPHIESTFPSSRTVTEFSRLQINCSSYTTPGNPPTTSYTWTYGGSTISSGAVLDISNIGRDRRGQYTCTASNTVGSDSETVSVDVQYAPKIKSTFPSNRTVRELTRLQIDCSSYTTPGNPPTTSYTWTYGGSTISSGAVLDINNISRDRRGQYTCTGSNTIGSDSETVSVDIQYLDRPKLLVNKSEVKENETVSLTCNVESNPTAELEIRNVDNNTRLATRDTNRLQFTIDRVQCLHNGTYLCTARNTQIGDMSNSSLKEINVKCSPRQDFRHKMDNIVAKQINETAALVADVIANPVPEFRWFRQESGGLTNISRDTIHSISNSRLQSVLDINISRTQDYGDYVLEMENSQGRKQLLFTLTSKGPNVDEESNILPIAIGIGVAVGIIAAVAGGVFMFRRRQRDRNSSDRRTVMKEEIEMIENEVYVSSTAIEGDIYAQPNKPKKANKLNTTDMVYENAINGLSNAGLQTEECSKTQIPKTGSDEDGLMYVQIDTTNQKPVQNTKQREAPTAYASISYGKVGDPQPDEDENKSIASN